MRGTLGPARNEELEGVSIEERVRYGTKISFIAGLFFFAAAAEVFFSSSVWEILQEFKIFVLIINKLIFFFCIVAIAIIIYLFNTTIICRILIIAHFAESCHPHTTLEDNIFSAEWLPFFISCHLATHKHTYTVYAGLT